MPDSSQNPGRRLGRAGPVVASALLVMLGCYSSDALLPPDTEVVFLDASPRVVTLGPGERFLLTATPRTVGGGALDGGAATWTVDDSEIATISSTGVVTAETAGSTAVHATVNGLTATAAVTVTPTPIRRAGFYVSPLGTPTAPGTAAAPWDLATALAHPPAVAPGDTIWLRNGVYHGCFSSELTGTAAQPIVVRSYPGDAVVLDGAGCDDAPLTLFGGYTWYWGLEITAAAPQRNEANNVNLFGNELKLINCVIHDAAGSGVGMWSAGAGGELYGSLVYNNGTKANLDHGVYLQNAVDTKWLRDNIIFHQMAYGIHAYGSEAASLDGLAFEGNVLFDNGTIGNGDGAPNILVGGYAPAGHVTIRRNLTFISGAGINVRLGYRATNRDVELRENTFIGGSLVLLLQRWLEDVVVAANRLEGSQRLVDVVGATSRYTWAGNTQVQRPATRAWGFNGMILPFGEWRDATGLGATDGVIDPPSTAALVFVQPNHYEAGRAHLAIYNPTGSASVTVDLGALLEPGTSFELRNAQTFFAPPTLTGRYDGGSMTIPMAPVEAVTPFGRPSRRPPLSGPRFQVFVLLPIS